VDSSNWHHADSGTSRRRRRRWRRWWRIDCHPKRRSIWRWRRRWRRTGYLGYKPADRNSSLCDHWYRRRWFWGDCWQRQLD
jgi:hypothetical protein